ncbi:unnamed protein product [Leuciscus chuanchicus]
MERALANSFAFTPLKKKSQSVDIPDESYAGSFVKDLLASPMIQNVTRSAKTEEKGINTTNIQKARSPRRGELKRGYTIGQGRRQPEASVQSPEPNDAALPLVLQQSDVSPN